MTVSLYLHLINCLTQSLLICGMSPVFGLFLIMATAAHGSAGSDSDIITHYVVLGRPAFIQLINGASGYELIFKKDGNLIFSFKKDAIFFQENWGSQFIFYMNGTLMIIKAERSFSGIYTLNIFDSDGTSLRSERFRLIIEGSAGSDSTNKTHYVALGRPAFIQLINGASGYELTLQKDGTVIFSFRKNINFRENWGSQFNFYMNGTLMITKAERNLSGIYTLGVFNLDGMNIRKETLNLIIEVPVTPPALSPLCLPHGELRVSCSSPVGDNPQYSWLLDGLPLNHSRPVYDDGKGAVILGKNTSGELTCTAKNNVSVANTTEMLPSCAVDTMPMLLAALGTMVLLPILTVGVYSYCRKRPHVQAEGQK
ncbi:uncharacterized protein [Paramormyrops kingsleyae]|uniref:uncharacterized protein isoform X1 n=1 Tax=Paramormyrops kingsleyae TaxID=1676925 RepID=UPI003B96FB2B